MLLLGRSQELGSEALVLQRGEAGPGVSHLDTSHNLLHQQAVSSLPTQTPAVTDLTPASPATAGQAVPRIQRVLGVEFSYQPPPKSTVPYAASLKGTHIGLPGQRCVGAPGRAEHHY
jgi:hypothetical protein